MKGDKIIIQDFHVAAAAEIMRLLLPRIRQAQGKFIITIAGESGSGKSEVAEALASHLSLEGTGTLIIQQDDYFVYPPKTNEKMRRQNLGHVGLSEVNLELLDENLTGIAQGSSEIEKPLVIFDEDRITTETVQLDEIDVVIVEGTYTTLLQTPHQRIFIDRTYLDTGDSRKLRAREEQDEFLESVLEIEHQIISSHKDKADLIVGSDYAVRKSKDARS